MKQQKEYLEDLKEIRSIMERSAKFISLNGISGIFIGIIALIGAAGAYIYSNGNFAETEVSSYQTAVSAHKISDLIQFYMVDALCTLSSAIIISILLTIRKARKNNLPVWDKTCKLLLINLMIPLIAGGIFCLILIYHGFFVLVAPATLLFYGLALYNASKYTLTGIKYLGISEMALGLASTLFLGYGFYFWVIGFGFLHIIYGIIYYFTYDRNH